MTEGVRSQFFPMSLPIGVYGQIVDRSAAASEIQQLNSKIFLHPELRLFQVPAERRANSTRMTQGYAAPHSETIVFYTEAQLPVGWFYSFREDPTTTFIDTIGFISAYRGQGLYSAFLAKYMAYQKALGLERITTSHHPNNRAILITELKAGFNIVGLELNESYGPLIKMALFMHEDRLKGFEQAFSMAPDPSRAFKS